MLQDRFLLCSACGTRFVWTAAQQARQAVAPERCPACAVLLPAPGRQRGLVKFYNQRKGWGFITPTTGADVFMHRSGLADDALHPLHEGDLVEFALQDSERGPQAVAITRLASALENS